MPAAASTSSAGATEEADFIANIATQPHQKGVRIGRLFALCPLLFASWILPAAAGSRPLPHDCQPARIDEQVQVSYVYDGDTVKLGDGRRIRFIGINTPEMGHHDTLTQPYAEAARKSLQEALKTGGDMLSLQYGEERQDHYGRLLAHAFLDNGENVAALLLRQGHATTLVVPPNTGKAECYAQIEREARSAGRGLWQHTTYQPQDSGTLPRDSRGFRIVQGRVENIQRTRQQTRVELQGLVVARISNSDLGNFAAGYLESLAGRRVELQGWVKPEREWLVIRVRHPAALSLAGE
jgi:endonuclease YncB( thermonuclease family)